MDSTSLEVPEVRLDQPGIVGGVRGEDFKALPTQIIQGFYDSIKKIESSSEKGLTPGLGSRNFPSHPAPSCHKIRSFRAGPFTFIYLPK